MRRPTRLCVSTCGYASQLEVATPAENGLDLPELRFGDGFDCEGCCFTFGKAHLDGFAAGPVDADLDLVGPAGTSTSISSPPANLPRSTPSIKTLYRRAVPPSEDGTLRTEIAVTYLGCPAARVKTSRRSLCGARSRTAEGGTACDAAVAIRSLYGWQRASSVAATLLTSAR
jgi:hypothetical protein